MRDVVIFGAGELGGALAHMLARQDVAATIRLVDSRPGVAAGMALDIAEAAPIEGFSTRLRGSTEIDIAPVGAIAVLTTDRPDSPDRSAGADDAAGLTMLTRCGRFVRELDGVIVCAGAGHRELVERGVRELGLPRTRLFGSAPEALAGALRAMVALEAHGAARDVALTVLGVPPDRVVVPWDEATISGLALTRALDEPALRRLAARVAPLWPPGPLALAAAAATAIRAVTGRSRRVMSCFVAPDDSGGRRARAAAEPVRLGPDGIERLLAPRLNVRDQVALDNAVLL